MGRRLRTTARIGDHFGAVFGFGLFADLGHDRGEMLRGDDAFAFPVGVDDAEHLVPFPLPRLDLDTNTVCAPRFSTCNRPGQRTDANPAAICSSETGNRKRNIRTVAAASAPFAR